MNTEEYLIKQGWKPGEGLRPGSIKKPLLVKHRKDNKGLGNNPNANDGWWERVFDGHLKSLDAFSGSNGVSFKTDQEKLRKTTSPLYGMFRSGGILKGTIEVDNPEPESTELSSEPDSTRASKKDKKDKSKKEKSKKEKSKKEKIKDKDSKKDKKKDEKKDKKEKNDKTGKDKKEKKDKESKKRKRDDPEEASKKSKSSKSS